MKLRRITQLLLITAALSQVVACDASSATTSTATKSATPASSVTTTSTTVPASPTATATPVPATPTSQPETRPVYGVSLSPRTYDQADFIEFFNLAQQAGGAVRWAGDWAELDDAGSGVEAITGLADQFNYVPVVEVNVFKQDPIELLRPLTDAQIDEYVRLAREFAAAGKPPYFGLGIEVNILYETMPGEFDRLVTLFDRAAAAVKEVSPETQVYTTFQLERMHGLAGGLWGGVDDPSQARWELIGRFPRADFIAFTTYPGLNYRNPEDVPASHYTEILEHTDGRSVAFTEVGWHSGEIFDGWDSSEEEQAAFAGRFIELMEPLGPALALWSFMFDIAGADLPLPFQSMAFMRPDNTPRPAFEVWRQGIGTVEQVD